MIIINLKSAIFTKEKNNRQDWGLAVDVSNFYGQEKNIATFTNLIREKHCRLILLLGMGETGKTFLSVKIAQLMKYECYFIIWRSLIIQEGSSFTIAPIIKEYLKWANLAS